MTSEKEPHLAVTQQGAGTSRRSFISKAAVGTGIAWTAPVIISGRALAQGTPCIETELNWADEGAGAFTSTVVEGVTISVSGSFYGGTSAVSPNQAVNTGEFGGQTDPWLQFNQTPVIGGGQLVTFSFSQPVSNVTWTFLDIDNGGTSWSDRLVMITSGYTFTPTDPVTMIGDGTPGDPFRSTVGPNIPNNSDQGNLELHYPGPITSLQFDYFCGPEGGGVNQRIGLTNIVFDVC